MSKEKDKSIFQHVMGSVFGLDKLPQALLFKKGYHKLAQIYRHTFWEGIKATYALLVGSYNRGRMGLLDPLLVFPFLSRALMRGISPDGAPRLPLPPAITEIVLPALVLGLLVGPMELVKNAIAFVLTIVLSPLVGFVHLLKHHKAKTLKKIVSDTKVKGLNFEAKTQKVPDHSRDRKKDVWHQQSLRNKKHETVGQLFQILDLKPTSKAVLDKCITQEPLGSDRDHLSFEIKTERISPSCGDHYNLNTSRLKFSVNFADTAQGSGKGAERKAAFEQLGLLKLRRG